MKESEDRLKKIAIEMDELVRDVGPKLIKLSHLREEARLIMEELNGVLQTP